MAPHPQPEPIAIVGSSCRFPGSSSSPSRLWQLLSNPQDVSKEIPDDRFELQGFYHPKGAHHGTTNVQRAYMLDEDVRIFDAGFFNISPNEADSMDPQQRLLMEVVYEALESGGHPLEGLRGSDTAVFVGTMSVDYNDILIRDLESTPTYFSTGTSRAILANRISYCFDWHGPSMTIDTACSSSMVALHQSVQALRAGEARVAVAGGTELLLGPEQFVGESKMNLLSPTGRSRMWDADADGYARGDGIAAVILKRLSDAIADGDHIESIIRDTGVNQDGKSTGLTVPSSEAQAALIRSTYARAGLDLSNPDDWPQFFEAHGTGTKVGDPREAAAISGCFGSQPIHGNPLYVGSIKTIIGHTEGTAGLAGVLKASLAIQHGVIPPNMLLNRLNPDVEQYYTNLHIPTSPIQWPVLPTGVPRRASVNSFGFGGTNGHAIIEAYEPTVNKIDDEQQQQSVVPVTPFVFSATTEESLVALLQSYSDYLQINSAIDLHSLAWTLQSRRSAFAFKTAVAASSIDGLVSRLESKVTQAKSTPPTPTGVRSTPATPHLLGVFTGQGAQWPTMGACLIQLSATVRAKLEQLDHSLATLPEADRPSWRIADQLLAPKGESRLSEAALSQPLCTAVQVVLVDLLRSAGITFDAVVGHSSGEIGAAYAAGFISAADAIRIAYYRGVHAKLAHGQTGQKGAMLAVGTSWEDAQELIDLPAFEGKIRIAAHNSAASLTLSGDADAIAHAKRVFDEEKKFARLLLVDTAYHSHHMLPCSGPYIDSLRACRIQVNKARDSSCTWFSSVRADGKPMTAGDELQDVYWSDNMVNAVLFADAVKRAAANETLNLAIEVGPHPALKGPAQQNVSDVRPSSPLPYTGLLSRGSSDVEAFSDALGFVWTYLGPGTVDFQSYTQLVTPAAPAPKLLPGLPSYPFSRDRVHWHESRRAKKMRQRGAAFHELLGVPSPDNTDQDLRWTNFLKTSEIPWLDGHKLQGQTVFPAAGYVAMALEAGKCLAGDQSVQVLEVRNLTIDRAITFDDGAGFAVETLVALTGISPRSAATKSSSSSSQMADFAVYACPNTGSLGMELVSKGQVHIVYGTPSFSVLASSPLDDSNMTAIDREQFYSTLSSLGYGYNGPFQTLAETKRRLGQASATVATYAYSDDERPLIVHPTMLDVAFQASFLAQTSPGDEQLWSLHVPTSIKCVRVNPELSASLPLASVELPLSAVLHEPESISLHSSVDVFAENKHETLLQVEGLVMKPFSPATAADDRPMFSTMEYGLAVPDAAVATGHEHPTEKEVVLAGVCDRVAYYYLRAWEEKAGAEKLIAGGHSSVTKAWIGDGEKDIQSLISQYPESLDLQLLATLGDSFSAETLAQALLDECFTRGIGFARASTGLARTVQQMSHRYPHAKIVEIGAGRGHVTESVLSAIGNAYSSYTFTDTSDDMFGTVAEVLQAHGENIDYKVFNPAKAPSAQGFTEHSYDVAILPNSLYTSSSLLIALENIRRLLKPGGYLVASAITHEPIRIQALLAGVSLSSDGPRASTSAWHSALRKAGFSGIDTISAEANRQVWPVSVLTAQAINDRTQLLRKPLSSIKGGFHLHELVILAGTSWESSRLAEEISDLAERFCDKVTVLKELPTDDDEISPMATFISLLDLSEPVFEGLNEEKIEGLKCLFELSKNILWVTHNARAGNPYHYASIGFGRSIAYEMPHLTLQFLDLDEVEDVVASSRLITESVVRLAALVEWEDKEMLWSIEPELYVEKGQVLVPRIRPNDEQNARINSLRRPVSEVIDPRQGTVGVISQAGDGESLILRKEPWDSSPLAVQIRQSTLHALAVVDGSMLFVGIGKQEATGETVITLSDTNASRSVPLVSLPIDIADLDQSAGLLASTANHLLAGSILASIPANGHLLVHEPGPDGALASVLAAQAAEKNVRVTFSTSSATTGDATWIKLNPWTPEHMLKQQLPAGITHFTDLGSPESQIRKYLPLGCRIISVHDLTRAQATNHSSGNDRIALLEALKGAANKAIAATATAPKPIAILPSQIRDPELPSSPASIIDWTVEATVPAEVHPLDATRFFSRDRTYLLVGLAGQLGQSICEWMARHGAGTVCLTSRTAKADPEWQAAMQKLGTTVRFDVLDVTKKEQVEQLVSELGTTCPLIAGVINGAAVFNDMLFSEMSLEVMERVTQPKVIGTKNLNEVFGTTPLDFFVVLSSLTSVIGNSGQTNYTAANAYMTGLVSERRSRGLAGSSLEIGRVAGIGYMERAGDIAREQLIRFGFMAISETDLHQLLAEAIHAGAPSSALAPVITTGCRTAHDDEEAPVAWFHDPRFSHKVIEARGQGAASEGKKSALPVQEQLAQATSKEEALRILKDCFAAKLALISRLSDDQVGHTVPLVELGIDSLVAVEVRGWFLKELKTDMPVLKVLGGGSVADLCQQALDKLPETLLPNLGGSVAAPPATVSKPATAPPAPKSEDSSASSAGPSSGSRSPLETPSTPPVEEESKQVNLSEAAERAALFQEGKQPDSPAYVKSELISFAQSRFWFLRLLIEDQTTFNVCFYYRITGNLRVGDLERAVRLVTNRHESLRTCFVADEKEADLAHQKVLRQSVVRLERKKIDRIEELHAEYAAMKTIPFDIASGKVLRLILLTLSPTENYLLFNYHHILMDGVSLQNFLSDLEKAYQRQPLGPPPRQLPDFSRSQRAAFDQGKMNEEITYWRQVFPDGHHPVLPLLPMATLSTRAPMKAFNVNQVQYRLPKTLVNQVKERAKAHRSTTFHFYLTVFRAMLFRFTEAEDLTIGIADANRNDSDVMGTIGLLLNLLTLRFQNESTQPFGDCLAESRDKAYEALHHSRVPFDVLLKELNVPRSASYSPFFQAFFDYRQGHQEKQQFGNTELEMVELHPGRTAYDMTLDITDSADSALILFRTQAGLYDPTATQLLLDTYVHLLEAFADNTSLALGEVSLFSNEQRKRAVDVGRGLDLKSTWPETLPLRIDQIAATNRDRIALKDGHGRILTYAVMINRIEAIAEELQNAGVQEGHRVLVFEDATADWPCSMLAIMRLGAVYVPLDLRNPLPRLADVAANCEPGAILVDNTTAKDIDQVNVTQAKVINVLRVSVKPTKRVRNVSRGDAVAAILYTSGSTGKPKGIVVKHSGLRNEIEGYTTQWGLRAERTLQQSAFTFNHSSDQIYTGLTNGGTVYIVPWSKRGDPIEVSQIIQEEGITYTKATPAEYALWLDYGNANLRKATNWRFGFGGGDSLTPTLLQQLAALDLPQLRFFNSYGPTEISISSTKMEIAYREKQPEGRIPCGYSLPNYAAYILDEQQRPVPVGMPGELWIGGAGVSLGYLNNPELTDYHFHSDPYATPAYVAQGWTRMYRTGDIAHLQADGALVFHSRVAGDAQVKIRGLRIELGDIESNIVKASDGALREAAVTLREGDPPLLVAHVVFAPNHTITNTEAFLDHLLQHLPVPQYMVPVMAIPLDRMPLSNHSKVDRKALKALPLPRRRTVSSEADVLSETMLQLRRVWEEVLHTEELGLQIVPSTSFFTIGGNSLLVVRLQSRIRHLFNVTVRLVDLLEASSLSAMAKLIEESTTVDAIDWKRESALPPDVTALSPSITLAQHPLKATGSVILITGAAGFLGKHILTELISNPNIQQIHCIGLREKTPGTPRTLAVSSEKIITHAGDLSDPYLGLSESTFARLAQEVDSILHMGAVRSFWDNYHLLRASNVLPTRELVKLAAPRQIPIHYISTAGVLPANAADTDSVVAAESVAAHPPPTDGSQGYIATRWVCEQLLHAATTQLHIPTTIHRFVPAPPGEESTLPALQHFLTFIDSLSLKPDFRGTKGHFEMIPVHDAAGSLASALFQGPGVHSVAEDKNSASPRFVHHECPVRIDIGEMERFMQQERGDTSLPAIPLLKWIGQMKRSGLEYFVTSQVLFMGDGEELESRR
ncbi:hypothetical protein ASPBRDRAFT_126737 [Aspergillus brasiliensis CBS 101740]|uniref:Carrier domain-containing protein n=1 Tax=Aspergillus brasiliensis (strain CBS 101740 / IMI 381727 / IBT 21946) TaxID=767769 RepID=A0A1L9UGK9_ASPBC|nr:hypothetical protein ASPBRDRAFT_126737 [Aspergillus brasiliensis CBS 101740]